MKRFLSCNVAFALFIVAQVVYGFSLAEARVLSEIKTPFNARLQYLEMSCSRTCLSNYNDIARCNSNKIIFDNINELELGLNNNEHFYTPIKNFFHKLIQK